MAQGNGNININRFDTTTLRGWLKDLVDRLFERETLVVIVALAAVLTGHVNDMPRAVALLGSVGVLIGGRSAVKIAQVQSLLQSAMGVGQAVEGQKDTTVTNVVNSPAATDTTTS